MKICKGMIVEVPVYLPPEGETKPHPCIVISNDEINEEEQGFVAVMITSEQRYKDDYYSFELTNEMVSKPSDKVWRAVRVHLIGYYMYSDVISNSISNNYIKPDHLKRLMTHIYSQVFEYHPSKRD